MDGKNDSKPGAYYPDSSENSVLKPIFTFFEKANAGDIRQIMLNDPIIGQSNVMTLEILNNLFNQTFTNGHLLVYIGGDIVFNSTPSNDLTKVLFDIIEKFLGQHEIKVEFTDADNDTKNYTENVTIK